VSTLPYWQAGSPDVGGGGAGTGDTVGAGAGGGTAVGTGEGDGVRTGVGVGLGLGDAMGVGLDVGDAVGVGLGDVVGDGSTGGGWPPGKPPNGRTATSVTADARMMTRRVTCSPMPG